MTILGIVTTRGSTHPTCCQMTQRARRLSHTVLAADYGAADHWPCRKRLDPDRTGRPTSPTDDVDRRLEEHIQRLIDRRGTKWGER